MAKISTLKNLEGNTVYPRTIAKAVYGLPVAGETNNIYSSDTELPPSDPSELLSNVVGDIYLYNDRVYILNTVTQTKLIWGEIKTIKSYIDTASLVVGVETYQKIVNDGYTKLEIDDSWLIPFEELGDPKLYLKAYDENDQLLDTITIYSVADGIDISSNIPIADYAKFGFLIEFVETVRTAINFEMSSQEQGGGGSTDSPTLFKGLGSPSNNIDANKGDIYYEYDSLYKYKGLWVCADDTPSMVYWVPYADDKGINNKVDEIIEYDSIEATAMVPTNFIDVSEYNDIKVNVWGESGWYGATLELHGYSNGSLIDTIVMHDSQTDIDTVDVHNYDNIKFYVGYSSGSTTIRYTLSNDVVRKTDLYDNLDESIYGAINAALNTIVGGLNNV